MYFMDHADAIGDALFYGCLVLAAYFLPAILAYRRHHDARQAILLVNGLFGWTVLGYLICLIWALSKPKAPANILKSSKDYLSVDDTIDCPQCAETIKAKAKKCRYCGTSLESERAVA